MKWVIHHVNLQAYNVSESLAFYRNVLGLKVGRSHTIGTGATRYNLAEDQFGTVGDGNQGLHVTRPKFDLVRRTGRPINASMNGHIGICVSDIDAVRRRLEAARVFFVDAGEHAMQGVRQIYLYDPSGNIVEINRDPSCLADDQQVSTQKP